MDTQQPILAVLRITQEQVDLFWSCVNRGGDSECWDWNRTIPTVGYGLIRLGGKQFAAHRLAWMLSNGRSLKSDIHVCHRCDRRECCNPAHLFIGTAKDNQVDCVLKGRKPHGAAHGMSVLAEDDVRQIRDLFDAGILPREIARQFKINDSTVHQIGKRRTWQHILERNGASPQPVPMGVSTRYGRRGKTPKPPDGSTIPTFQLPGFPDIILSERQIARFWRKVHKGSAEECWTWQGHLEHCGDGIRGGPYGRVGFFGRLFYTHRIAWLLHNKVEIPEGMVICHRCDVGPCCNPAHLFPGTSRRNTVDAFNRGRRQTGEKHHHAKLNEEQVRKIRNMRAAGLSLSKIASAMGVGVTIIHRIVTGIAWQHVADQIGDAEGQVIKPNASSSAL